MERISHARLKEVVHYDPETGHFTRLKSPYPACIGRRLGSPLQGRDSLPTYLTVDVERRTYKAHRLAWFYMTGEWPNELIDHKNCDGFNNRWNNLRQADQSRNQQNSRIRSHNTSGFKGVSRHSQSGKWRATIKAGGRRISLGLFLNPGDAHAAYEKAAIEHFGEFARAA